LPGSQKASPTVNREKGLKMKWRGLNLRHFFKAGIERKIILNPMAK
jgi:hypothetical protein